MSSSLRRLKPLPKWGKMSPRRFRFMNLFVHDVPRSERYGKGLGIVNFFLMCTAGILIGGGATGITFNVRKGAVAGWHHLVIEAAFIILGLITIAVANSVGRVGVRHLSEVIDSHLDIQDEVFTLYLRAFVADSAMSQPQRLSVAGSILRTILTIGRTEEQQLAYVLEPVAEVVAVGIPGELLPYAGAKRLYLPAKGWHGPVRELMQRARIVMIMLGPGSGVIWELTEAVRLVPPERLLLAVPMTREQYNDFRQCATAGESPMSARAADGALVPFMLPDFSGQPEILSKLQGLIYFSSTWEATFIPLTRYSAFYNSLRGSLAHAIRPFLQQLGEHEDNVRKYPQPSQSDTAVPALES